MTFEELSFLFLLSKIIEIAMEERKYDDDRTLLRSVKLIQDQTGAKIDVSISKNHNLTLVLTGRPECIRKARLDITQQLTKEVCSCCLL